MAEAGAGSDAETTQSSPALIPQSKVCFNFALGVCQETLVNVLLPPLKEFGAIASRLFLMCFGFGPPIASRPSPFK